MRDAQATDDALERERAAVDRALTGIADEYLAAAPSALSMPIRYALAAGGKRLRPILCLATYRAVVRAAGSAGTRPRGVDTDASADAVPDAVLRMACAVEVLHTYSLIHDDLPCMDDALLRRGSPSTHRRFGVEAATLAAAAMIPLAFRMLEDGACGAGLARPMRARVASELATGAGAAGMVGGQVLDLAAEGRPLELNQLERIHRAKTGALLTAALRIGAVAAGAGSETITAITRYGEGVGLAFQIVDDLLDVTGRAAETGKPPGGDAAREKATFPGLLGVEAARARARSEIDAAVEALTVAGLNEPALVALARFAAERDR